MNGNGWISRRDALPDLPDGAPRSKIVIAYYCGEVIPMLYERAVRGRGTETRWRFCGDRIAPTEPTHWMLLPEPPE